jgi:pyridinium-3,5-biscarboxylic acid mononucleotide sulfurtransferase
MEDPMNTEAKYASLKKIITDLQSVVVAFSGGVDSTFLLKVCVDTLGKDNVLAFIGRSPTCPDREIEAAKGLAAFIGSEYLIEETSEMNDPRFIENNKSRCYFCKTHLFVKAKEIAARQSLLHVVEGSNLDDMDDFRPGRKACAEQAVRSPLLEANLKKLEIRQLSQQLLLPTYDKPSFACLSSRVPYGISIDTTILKKIERSENFIQGLGIRQVRVSYHGDMARIEALPEDFDAILANREKIAAALIQYGFSHVALDLKGYRAGSMNLLSE